MLKLVSTEKNTFFISLFLWDEKNKIRRNCAK